MKLISSNPHKIWEFRDILWDKLEIKEWIDIKEVDGTAREVILHKAIDAWEGYIVEDTIVKIDWVEQVDIRWNIEGLKDHVWKKVQWIVHIWHNTWDSVIIYKGVISGIISNSSGDSGFWFDPYFIPKWEKQTLAELNKVWLKHNHSARKIALENLLNQKEEEKIEIIDIPEWTWGYQSE